MAEIKAGSCISYNHSWQSNANADDGSRNK